MTIKDWRCVYIMSAIYIVCVLGYLKLYQPHQTKNDNNYRTMAIDINIILQIVMLKYLI